MLLALLLGAAQAQTSRTVQPGGLNTETYTASFAPAAVAASSATVSASYNDYTGWSRYPKRTILASQLFYKMVTPYEARNGACRKLCAETFKKTCVGITLAPQNVYFPGAYDCTLFKPESQLQMVTCSNATNGLAMVLQSHPTLNTTVDSASCGPPVS